MGPFAGYDMPIQYPRGVLAEHQHTRSAAGLFDVSHMGQALLEAPDHEAAAGFLESLCAADLRSLAPGRQRYTQLLNDEGGIVDDLMVSRPPGADGSTEARGQRLSEGCRLRPDRRAAAPRRRPHAARRSGAGRPTGPARGDHPEAHRPGSRRRHDAFHGRAGRPSSARSTPSSPARATPARTATRSRCRPPRRKPLPGCSWPNRKSPRLGSAPETRSDSRLVSVSMGTNSTRPSIRSRRRSPGRSRNGVGSKAVFRAPARFSARLPKGQAASGSVCGPDGRAPARDGTEIVAADGAPVGVVTSGGFGPSVGAPIAMGFVDRAHAAIGTPVGLVVRGKIMSARVVALPFHPHAYHRG